MKTFAVIGLGRFGEAVAKKLFETGCEVLAVDIDAAKVQAISDFVTHAVSCDAKNESSLKSLGMRNYDCVIVAIGDNITDSVLVTLMLREMGTKKIICKAADENHRKILLKVGADNVVIPEHEMGAKLAMNLRSGRMIEYIELSDVYGIAEASIPKDWIGKTIMELEIRRKYRINVIGIKHTENDSMVINPPAEYCFENGDIVVLIGRNEDIGKIK